MPDKFGFDHLDEIVRCIEPECEAGGRIYEWREDRRKVHFLSHNFVLDGDSPEFAGAKRSDNCRVCGRQFDQERKRGRPRVLCYICKPLGGEL